MKIILNTNFQIESIDDEKASRIVKGSNLFDELGVYIPQALYNSYTSIYPSYSVKRADNRQLGEYAMATADNTSFTGYYGWKTHLHQRDLAVAGPLEITISFALNGTVKKTICKVTANVDSAIELSNDVFIVTRGENDEILAIESLVDAVKDLQQECTQVSNTLLTKADKENADQELTAKSVEAETFEQDGNNVLDSSDVVDNVTTEDATKVLSAKQGKVLKTLIDALTTSLSTEYYKKAQTYSSTEIDGLIANFVTKSVNDLTNYYLKSETYNKTEIDNMLSTLSSFEVVQTLPTENIKTSVIYLLQNGQFYDEYIYSNNDWVMIGTTNIDFSDYYTKAQINAMLNVINEAINGVDIVNEEVVFEADVPSSAKGLVTLSKLGGMSYKSENLLIPTLATTTANGVTCTNNGDGTYTLNGTATAGTSFTLKNILLPVGTYKMVGCLNGGYDTYTLRLYNSATNYLKVDLGSGVIFTTESELTYQVFINIANGMTFDNVLFKPMITTDTTLTYNDFQIGFEGIRDSAVTSLVSKGANLWDEEFELGTINADTGQNTTSSATCRCKNYQRVIPNTTYTLNYVYRIFFYDSSYNYLGYSSLADTTGVGKSFTTPINCYYVRFNFVGEYGTTYLHNIMLNKGTTALPYEPYKVLATQPIASEIQALEGYGWGVNADCYNYIDYERKVFVKKVGRVDLGSLDYTRTTSYNNPFFYCSISGLKINGNAIASIYNKINNSSAGIFGQDSNNLDFCIGNSTNQIFIRNDSYTTAEAFKTAMNGVYLYYELATPIETDISSYLGDKHIPIEANGSLTFTNTYNQAVPSTITFDCGLIEVVKTNHEHDLEQQKDIDTLKANQKQLQTDVSGLDTRLDDVEEDVTALNGVHLYQHYINVKENYNYANVSIISTRDTEYDYQSLLSYLSDFPNGIIASGKIEYNSVYGVAITLRYSSSDNSMFINFVISNDARNYYLTNNVTITDTVKPLF